MTDEKLYMSVRVNGAAFWRELTETERQQFAAFAEAVRTDERERCAKELETRDVYVAAAAFVRSRQGWVSR